MSARSDAIASLILVVGLLALAGYSTRWTAQPSARTCPPGQLLGEVLEGVPPGYQIVLNADQVKRLKELNAEKGGTEIPSTLDKFIAVVSPNGDAAMVVGAAGDCSYGIIPLREPQNWAKIYGQAS